jgi:hypothetical protein
MADAPALPIEFNQSGRYLLDTFQIGKDTPLSRQTRSLIEGRKQFDIPVMARALTLSTESIRGVKPELFIPHALANVRL